MKVLQIILIMLLTVIGLGYIGILDTGLGIGIIVAMLIAFRAGFRS